MEIDKLFDKELPSKKREYAPCRHNPTLICQIDGVRFYGASRSRLNNQTLAECHADLLINLTGFTLYHQSEQLIKRAQRRWNPLRKYFERNRVEEIVLDWPDMKVIPVGRKFWSDFFSLIKKAKKKNVVVFCVGGHGRTGTCVASFMTVMLKIHGGQAIRTIREGYCREAVETKVQEDYVRALTLPTVKAEDVSAPSRNGRAQKSEKKKGGES